jgi:hypothetical protein
MVWIKRLSSGIFSYMDVLSVCKEALLALYTGAHTPSSTLRVSLLGLGDTAT